MRVVRTVALILLVIAVPLFLITTNLRIIINSGWLYSYGFDRHNVPAATGIEKPELMRIAREFKRYFNDETLAMDVKAVVNGREIDLFNDREIEHMKDVKGLVKGLGFWQRMTFFYMVTLSIAGVAFLGRRWTIALLGQGILWGSLTTVALITAAGVGSIVGFDSLFTTFHLLSFANDLWSFDPRVDHLVQIFPEAFFRDATLMVAGLCLVQAVLTAAVIVFLRRHPPEVMRDVPASVPRYTH